MRTKPIFCVFAGIVLLFPHCSPHSEYGRINGFALGTTYAVTFKMPEGASPSFTQTVQTALDGCFDQVNNSLSIYNNHSLISRLNNNLTVNTDSLFNIVFRRSVEINLLTGGAFDISAGPLFDAWGFGEHDRIPVTQAQIEEIKKQTGMHLFNLKDGVISKTHPKATLSMNAIAKGFTSDLAGHRLDSLGIPDYLVEIGGEIVCKGVNPQGQSWRIGIDSPVDGNNSPGKDLQTVLTLTSGKGLATSGNYRNYYMENGKKYAHIIDPVTGFPVQHSLLSVTVIASDCMTADAYATALMVMGLEKSKTFLSLHPELGAFLIYDHNGSFETFVTDNIAASVIRQ